jgi:hypothetical protein
VSGPVRNAGVSAENGQPSVPDGWPDCDACSKPAVTICVDMKRVDPPGAKWKQYKPQGRHRAGCKDHPVKSLGYMHDGITLEAERGEGPPLNAQDCL